MELSTRYSLSLAKFCYCIGHLKQPRIAPINRQLEDIPAMGTNYRWLGTAPHNSNP